MKSGADIILHRVPPHGVSAVAKLYGPLLCRAMAAAGEKDLRACLVDLAIGRRQLWAIFSQKHSGPVALFRTEIVVEPWGGKWLVVSGLAGADMRSWARLLSETMAMTARDWGCSCVRFAGREAWGRLLPEFKRVGRVDGEAVFERAAA